MDSQDSQNTNGVYIEPVNPDSSGKSLEDSERKAGALKEQTRRAEQKSTEREADNAAEASVYGSLLASAMGIPPILSSLGEFMDTRYSDKNKTKATQRTPIPSGGKRPSTGTIKSSKGKKHPEGVFSRIQIARMSLTQQEPKALKTWAVKEAKMPSVPHVQELVFSQELVNKKILQQARELRQERRIARQHIQGMMLAMGLGSGPRINPASLLRDSENQD